MQREYLRLQFLFSRSDGQQLFHLRVFFIYNIQRRVYTVGLEFLGVSSPHAIDTRAGVHECRYYMLGMAA
jgi:hypothetical protein